MDKAYYEKTNYSVIVRHLYRAEKNRLTLCDVCNPLQTLNCAYCDWHGCTSILCNRVGDIRKLVR